MTRPRVQTRNEIPWCYWSVLLLHLGVDQTDRRSRAPLVHLRSEAAVGEYGSEEGTLDLETLCVDHGTSKESTQSELTPL